MKTEVLNMIDFLLAELRRQPGVTIPDAAGTAAMVAACTTYGGERLYVPKFPKLQTAVRIVEAERSGARTDAQIAMATGVSERSVRRLRVRVRTAG